MSNLYKSAIGARLAKLPADIPYTRHPGADEDTEADEEEENDLIGDLPGSGLGPPALQVDSRFILDISSDPKWHTLQGQLITHEINQNALQIPRFRQSQLRVSLKMLRKYRYLIEV